GYAHWDDIAARMVDAQAPGLAERLRALASVPHSGAGWDGRLLEEYALLHLLAVAYRRQAELPPPLRDTVRSRVGFSLRPADGPRCWGGGSRSGPTGGCGPGATSSRTGSGPAGPGCAAARPGGTRCCSASRRRARRSTTRWPSAPAPTRTWCSTPARSRCARPCWPGTTTPTAPRRPTERRDRKSTRLNSSH